MSAAKCNHGTEDDQSSGKAVKQTGGDCRVTQCCNICHIAKLEIAYGSHNLKSTGTYLTAFLLENTMNKEYFGVLH